MKRIELVQFNAPLLQRLKSAGISLDDYKCCALYRDYEEISATESNRKVVFLTLSQRYGLSVRQLYNIFNHLETSVPPSD